MVNNLRDIRLVNRAMNNGWPVPEETKRLVVESLATLVTDEGKPDKTRIAASETLVKIGKLNASLNPKRSEVELNISIKEKKAALQNRVAEMFPDAQSSQN